MADELLQNILSRIVRPLIYRIKDHGPPYRSVVYPDGTIYQESIPIEEQHDFKFGTDWKKPRVVSPENQLVPFRVAYLSELISTDDDPIPKDPLLSRPDAPTPEWFLNMADQLYVEVPIVDEVNDRKLVIIIKTKDWNELPSLATGLIIARLYDEWVLRKDLSFEITKIFEDIGVPVRAITYNADSLENRYEPPTRAPSTLTISRWSSSAPVVLIDGLAQKVSSVTTYIREELKSRNIQTYAPNAYRLQELLRGEGVEPYSLYDAAHIGLYVASFYLLAQAQGDFGVVESVPLVVAAVESARPDARPILDPIIVAAAIIGAAANPIAAAQITGTAVVAGTRATKEVIDLFNTLVGTFLLIGGSVLGLALAFPNNKDESS